MGVGGRVRVRALRREGTLKRRSLPPPGEEGSL